MYGLRKLETSELVDLLVNQIADFARKRSEGVSDKDYAKHNLIIRSIHEEINARKTIGDTVSQHSLIYFTKPPDFS